MRRFPLILFVALAMLSSCKKTPDYVISEDEMAELMADIETANAVVEMDFRDYSNDSSKIILLKSILEKHGVTEQQFDTSLMWYGHNLDIYRDVYKHTVELLQDRQKDIVAEAKEAGEKMTLAGDSVDIWQGSRYSIFTKKQFGDYAQVDFSIPADENSRLGDRYYWKLRLYNALAEGHALLGVDYSDGSSEFQTKEVHSDETVELSVQSDSLVNVTRIYGYMLYEMKDEDAVFADSLSLYRSRLNSERYNFHGFQRKIKP